MATKKAIEDLEKLFTDILWGHIGEDFHRRASEILVALKTEKSTQMDELNEQTKAREPPK